jgi:type I phosphodiesterase/nucleotide pyrophosphatase
MEAVMPRGKPERGSAIHFLFSVSSVSLWRRGWRLGGVAVACLLAAGAAAAPAGPAGPAERVLIVMLDGTRPDALRRARVPVLQGLAAAGTEFLQAETVYPSQTRVAFVTLPTGAFPGSHGIVGGNDIKDPEWRTVAMGDDDPLAAQALVARATFFEDAAAAGLTSLYAAMKGYELVGARGATWTINGKQTLETAAYATRYQPAVAGNAEAAAWQKELLSRQLLDQSLAVIREHRPHLVVINLGSADYAAHAFGPESPYYLRTLEYEDALVGELLEAYRSLGLLEKTAVVVSADHGFSQVNVSRVVAPVSDAGGHRLEALAALGLEHYVTNTGGASMGVYVRDKARVPQAVAALRREPWCEAVYCEDAGAGCDRSLSSLRAWYPGRSPDLMVDLDDDAALNFPNPGQHGSARPADRRIPLLLSGAGVARGRAAGKASLADVAPTVLRLLGVPAVKLRPDGRVLEEALSH